MGRYWIRNRGRTQGPLSADKIHGLLRRGRFNRHYQVSEDRKNWYVATEFPELFPEAPAGRGGRGGGGDFDDDDDDGGGGGGGSPFDDDYEAAPPKRRSGSRRSRDDDAPRDSPFSEDDDEDDDDYEDEVDDRDDDDDDEDDWDDDEGAVYRLVGWIEQKWQGVVVLLVAVMIGLGWFVFFRETFAQDQIDLDLLMDVHGRITAKNAGGVDSNEWSRLADDTELELAGMVDRLKNQASARDHIKQELLFAARDDLRRVFDELPNGIDTAAQRALTRFRDVEAMIKAKTRQKTDDMIPPPVQPPPAETPDADPANGAPDDLGAPSQPGDAVTPPVGSSPAPAL